MPLDIGAHAAIGRLQHHPGRRRATIDERHRRSEACPIGPHQKGLVNAEFPTLRQIEGISLEAQRPPGILRLCRIARAAIDSVSPPAQHRFPPQARDLIQNAPLLGLPREALVESLQIRYRQHRNQPHEDQHDDQFQQRKSPVAAPLRSTGKPAPQTQSRPRLHARTLSQHPWSPGHSKHLHRGVPPFRKTATGLSNFPRLGFGDTYLSFSVSLPSGATSTGGEGSADGYWRDSVFDNELMSPYFGSGQTEPLSAITVQSLADMGYVVDASQADSFTLPAAMSRIPGLVPKAAGVSAPLNCRIEPSVGTVEGGGRKRVILEAGLL